MVQTATVRVTLTARPVLAASARRKDEQPETTCRGLAATRASPGRLSLCALRGLYASISGKLYCNSTHS